MERPRLKVRVPNRLLATQHASFGSLELHSALGCPCGKPDVDYVYDGPFFHGLAGRSEIDLSKLLPAETQRIQQDFDLLLQSLLASLAGYMKPLLLGSARRNKELWTFAGTEHQPAEAAAA